MPIVFEQLKQQTLFFRLNRSPGLLDAHSILWECVWSKHEPETNILNIFYTSFGIQHHNSCQIWSCRISLWEGYERRYASSTVIFFPSFCSFFCELYCYILSAECTLELRPSN